MAKPTISYDVRRKIVAQALKEIQFARQYKQGKIGNWKINEDLYYGRKLATEDSRANVDLGQMGSFVHTILSKIDTPLVFKFTKRKLAQLQRIAQLNALRNADSINDDWDIKDLAGKKQALIYGRAIYSYFADSIDGAYRSHLDPVDVYDFLIDPSAGGLDLERGMYMGRFGVVKTREEIKAGVKDGLYLKTESQNLLDGAGNSTDTTQEETNKINRTVAQNVWKSEKEIGNPDKYKFWQWYTTFEGERYYLLLQEKGATAIRVEPLKEVFESNLWPFWSWAAFLDLTEFWTPSYCDYVRDIFMAQAISINQLLDNAEEINKPVKAINVAAIENLAELKYRKGGWIKFKKDFDIEKSIQMLRPPSITTPINVFSVLQGIGERNSGVTAAAQGDAPNGSGQKVGIYDGNQENSADRFGLLNRSYAFGYKRFAKLYEKGVREHLVKKVAVDLLGPDGVETIEVSRRDIFRKGDECSVMVEASNAEVALSEKEKAMKMVFLKESSVLSSQGKPIQNQKKAYEIMAGIAGFDEETIRQLQDVDNFGDAETMAEADRDIEDILDGKIIEPNPVADTAYKQRFVDYMQKNGENITSEQFKTLAEYVISLDDIIMRNMVRKANDLLLKQTLEMAAQPVDPAAAVASPSGGVGGNAGAGI